MSLWQFVPSGDGVKIVTRDGQEFPCDDWGEIDKLPKLFDTDFIPKLPPFDTFFDVGPGEVNTEAWWVKKERPKVEVIGFEPSTKRFQTLQNTFPGTLYKVAISDTEGYTPFFCGPDDGDMAHLITPPDGTTRQIDSVQSWTIDSILQDNQFGQVFVWADIEGSAMRLLHGAKRSLEQGKIAGLLVEVWAFRFGSAWGSYKDDVVTFLRQYGYEPAYTLVSGYRLAYDLADVIFLRK